MRMFPYNEIFSFWYHLHPSVGYFLNHEQIHTRQNENTNNIQLIISFKTWEIRMEFKEWNFINFSRITIQHNSTIHVSRLKSFITNERFLIQLINRTGSYNNNINELKGENFLAQKIQTFKISSHLMAENGKFTFHLKTKTHSYEKRNEYV